jgi:hypothetical protein
MLTKRLKKLFFVVVRKAACRFKKWKIYYWADERCYKLRTVHIMPILFYRTVFKLGMLLANYHRFDRLAYRLIHTVPYNIRFYEA